MFTGIIEITGSVLALKPRGNGARLVIAVPGDDFEVAVGESIAINGCCLTVADISHDALAFDLLAETLERTNLKTLGLGSVVNMERAMPANGRFGGHIVQGHVDCTSIVLGFDKKGADYRLETALPAQFARYVVSKGSIAIDGISLTVAEVLNASFICWIIPHTLMVTNLHAQQQSGTVNLEFDLMAKYAERLASKA